MSEQWDVLVIGGGINGAGIARDLMLRDAGLKVALVDKGHFASGTSGRNSQLIHGGLRYLKYFDFGLVKEALRERATLLKMAPSLVRPLEFLIPCFKAIDRWFYGAGLTLYDALSGGAHHHKLSAAQLSTREPEMAPARAGLSFMDARVHSARLVLENIIDADRRGACIVNYFDPSQLGKVRAKKVVDATGAWSQGAPLRLVRGSHLIFPRIQNGGEAIAHFDEGGRIIFLIPWGENDDLTLVGTTDVDHEGGPDDVHISKAETEYLTGIVYRLFPAFRGEPISSYSSLRPLIAEAGRSATSTSREHRIWETADGVLHIAGGKYTTYRAMAEELVDMLLPNHPCRTATTPFEIPEIPNDVRSRVEMAVRREYALKLPDLLYVSTYWGYERRLSPEWTEPLARQMAELIASAQ